MRTHRRIASLVIPATLSIALIGCEQGQGPALEAGSVDASQYTRDHNQALYQELNFEDRDDFEAAQRGLIAAGPTQAIKNAEGKTVFDGPSYAFLKGESPATVNPSLWRQAKLNSISGLFKVQDGIYQLRGFDLANMTLIDSDNGWIVVDPLTTTETAAAAIAFAREHLGHKEVAGIIFTHSHPDHFGGVLGVVSKEDIDNRKAAGNPLPVIAPSGFIEESVSEMVIAGEAMTRRGVFMYGATLEHSPIGHVDSGLGKQPVFGTLGILEPSITIDQAKQTHTIDGVEMVFLNMPGSEAPSELTFYLPEHRAYCGAEVTNRTLHNLYTLRGAKVRDGLSWSTHINRSIAELKDIDTYFGSHHWPIWGQEKIVDFVEKQRDVYRFIHDQTLQMANKGFTPKEIAETIKLPKSLSEVFFNRDYYGTVKHNSKAVYQHYFGWYDANPANLNPLPPVEAGQRYVEFMGGGEAVLSKAQVSFDQGEYRWAAEVLNHLVFADPDNAQAKQLLAASYRQMGYQAESAPWRDVYLTGSQELLEGAAANQLEKKSVLGLLRNVPTEEFMKSMATKIKAEDAEGLDETIRLVFTDTQESYVLNVKNSVLHYEKNAGEVEVNATLTLTLKEFLDYQVGIISMKDMVMSDNLSVEGSTLDLLKFLSLLDTSLSNFEIVRP